MKVIVQKSEGKTGKGKFTIRLTTALRKIGVEVINDTNARGDIALHIGRVHYKSRCRRNVLRLGPAHVNSAQNYKKLNKEKYKSVKQVDAIVYQSKYSKKVCRHFIGKRDVPETIIFNGADPEAKCMAQMGDYKYNFIASTRKWIPQKRLEAIQNAFMDAEIANSTLFICGNTLNNRKYSTYSHGAIRYPGIVSDSALAGLYRRCNAMIHIPYLDACPNSVVEALVSGCPVITTDQGGTKELCGMESVVLKDKPYDFKPVNLEKPPKINVDDLARTIQIYARERLPFERRDLWIDNIAKQYLKFFKSIL